MTAAADHFASFVDVLADALDDHEVTGEDWRPGSTCRGSTSTGSSRRWPVSRRAGSGGGLLLERSAYRLLTTRRHHPRHRRRGGVRVARGVHPGVHQGVRRRARPVAHPPDADPDRGAQRRALPPTREPAAPRREEGDPHGPPHQDGRAPRLADRRDRRARRAAHRRAARRADRAQRRRRPADHPRPSPPGSSARWACGTPRSPNRDYDWSVEEHESVESLRSRLAVEGPAYLAQVREVVEQGRLDDTFVDALCEPAEVFTYGGMIAHVLTFAAHRRCLVVMALDQARDLRPRLGRPDALGRASSRRSAAETPVRLNGAGGRRPLPLRPGGRRHRRRGALPPLRPARPARARRDRCGRLVPAVRPRGAPDLGGGAGRAAAAAAVRRGAADLARRLQRQPAARSCCCRSAWWRSRPSGSRWWPTTSSRRSPGRRPSRSVPSSRRRTPCRRPRSRAGSASRAGSSRSWRGVAAERRDGPGRAAHRHRRRRRGTAVALGDAIAVLDVGLDFLLAAVGGRAVGLLLYFVVGRVRRRVTDPVIDTSLSLVTPFVAYVAAEEIHGSGVLAVVVAGLLLGHKSPILQTATSRIAERLNWRTIQFLLENTVFLLIGLQARWILRDVQDSGVPRVRRRHALPGHVRRGRRAPAGVGVPGPVPAGPARPGQGDRAAPVVAAHHRARLGGDARRGDAGRGVRDPGGVRLPRDADPDRAVRGGRDAVRPGLDAAVAGAPAQAARPRPARGRAGPGRAVREGVRRRPGAARAAPQRRRPVQHRRRRCGTGPSSATPPPGSGSGAPARTRRPRASPTPGCGWRCSTPSGARCCTCAAPARSRTRWSRTCSRRSTSRSRCSTSATTAAGRASRTPRRSAASPGTIARLRAPRGGAPRTPSRGSSGSARTACGTGSPSGCTCASAWRAGTWPAATPRRGSTPAEHFEETRHPVMRSAEPGEEWRWCFVDNRLG